MRSLILTAAAGGLGIALLFAAACNPLDDSAPRQQQANATKTSPPPAAPAQQAPAATLAQPADKVRRVTVNELKAMLDKGEALALDVRGESSYQMGHIEGAKVILESELAKRFGELPKDKLIVTYCS